MPAHGVSFGAAIDLDKLRAWKDKVVKQSPEASGAWPSSARCAWCVASANSSRRTLEVDRRRRQRNWSLRASHHRRRLAGGEAAGPPLGRPRMMDSTDALDLADIPALLVIGGGIIGLEMACVYDALGSEGDGGRTARPAHAGRRSDLVKPLEKRWKRYAGIMLKVTKVAKVEAARRAHASPLRAKSPEPQTIRPRAGGRRPRPNGDKLNAERPASTVTIAGSFPSTSRCAPTCRTSSPSAIIVGQPMLAHKATHEGKVAAEVAAGHKSEFDARVIPSVAYTDPEVPGSASPKPKPRRKGPTVSASSRMGGFRPRHRHRSHRRLHQADLR
jgi:dihydrolipoamide dehydrogenase